MPDQKFESVEHKHEEFVEKAMGRPGFGRGKARESCARTENQPLFTIPA